MDRKKGQRIPIENILATRRGNRQIVEKQRPEKSRQGKNKKIAEFFLYFLRKQKVVEIFFSVIIHACIYKKSNSEYFGNFGKE
jgi:hypothetical protein